MYRVDMTALTDEWNALMDKVRVIAEEDPSPEMIRRLTAAVGKTRDVVMAQIHGERPLP